MKESMKTKIIIGVLALVIFWTFYYYVKVTCFDMVVSEYDLSETVGEAIGWIWFFVLLPSQRVFLTLSEWIVSFFRIPFDEN